MFGRESLRELIRTQHGETREFNREILLRNEKVYTSVLERLDEMGKEIRENTAETRAGTQAILRLFDRFDEPGGAAA